MIQHNKRIEDLIYNMHESSGATDDYRKGIIVATVCTLMAIDRIQFQHAVDVCVFHMPDNGVRLIVPKLWRKDFQDSMRKYQKSLSTSNDLDGTQNIGK